MITIQFIVPEHNRSLLILKDFICFSSLMIAVKFRIVTLGDLLAIAFGNLFLVVCSCVICTRRAQFNFNFSSVQLFNCVEAWLIHRRLYEYPRSIVYCNPGSFRFTNRYCLRGTQLCFYFTSHLELSAQPPVFISAIFELRTFFGFSKVAPFTVISCHGCWFFFFLTSLCQK